MLYIIRHGKTDWNIRHKLQGRTDVPLNDIGRQMARDAHDEYLNVHFDYCFCSPLKRAQETAKILLDGRDVPIITDERLVEMGFGIYEGVENVFNKPECPVRELFFNPAEYEAVGGAESLEELLARTDHFLNDVAFPLVEEDKDVLIVGHGAMNSAIVCLVKHKSVDQLWEEGIENCKLIKLM
ncbi:histidine phosphatase family protein [Butyrivibrio sp. AE2032]|uniref:histidine phosphatase family protein n=1 Tax=Butyrivibrio sp. AE2032 TaxID=1458463 RepID=UPI00054D3568|nr:histidine phosphatase family protein [Butyrivibrio sp. AE2032]